MEVVLADCWPVQQPGTRWVTAVCLLCVFKKPVFSSCSQKRTKRRKNESDFKEWNCFLKTKLNLVHRPKGLPTPFPQSTNPDSVALTLNRFSNGLIACKWFPDEIETISPEMVTKRMLGWTILHSEDSSQSFKAPKAWKTRGVSSIPSVPSTWRWLLQTQSSFDCFLPRAVRQVGQNFRKHSTFGWSISCPASWPSVWLSSSSSSVDTVTQRAPLWIFESN